MYSEGVGQSKMGGAGKTNDRQERHTNLVIMSYKNKGK